MDRHEPTRAAFLAGELDPAGARAFDEHLLSCEPCWRAVREDRLAHSAAARLREAAPADLADRIRFAVEVQAGTPSPRRLPSRRAWAAAASLVVAAAIALTALVPDRAVNPAPIAAVVQYARLIPAPAASDAPSAQASPAAVGQPLVLDAHGTRIDLRYFRAGTVELVVATADRPFPEPAGAHELVPGRMAWSADAGGVTLYCPNSQVLLAGPLPAQQLAALATRIPAE